MKYLPFLLIGLLFFSSCDRTEEPMTDEELIQAIQDAEKENVDAASLPNDAQNLLSSDFSESYNEANLKAADLGYEIRMRRGEGSQIGTRTDLYFDLDGRRLGSDRNSDQTQDGTDRHECFHFVYPLTFTMPDGSQITGNNAEEMRSAIQNWYDNNPVSDVRPTLVFPVSIAFNHIDALTTINNEAELEEAYRDCFRDDVAYDCPNLHANIGDDCRRDDDTVGTVSADCACL